MVWLTREASAWPRLLVCAVSWAGRRTRNSRDKKREGKNVTAFPPPLDHSRLGKLLVIDSPWWLSCSSSHPSPSAASGLFDGVFREPRLDRPAQPAALGTIGNRFPRGKTGSPIAISSMRALHQAKLRSFQARACPAWNPVGSGPVVPAIQRMIEYNFVFLCKSLPQSTGARPCVCCVFSAKNLGSLRQSRLASCRRLARSSCKSGHLTHTKVGRK